MEASISWMEELIQAASALIHGSGELRRTRHKATLQLQRGQSCPVLGSLRAPACRVGK